MDAVESEVEESSTVDTIELDNPTAGARYLIKKGQRLIVRFNPPTENQYWSVMMARPVIHYTNGGEDIGTPPSWINFRRGIRLQRQVDGSWEYQDDACQKSFHQRNVRIICDGNRAGASVQRVVSEPATDNMYVIWRGVSPTEPALAD